MEQQTKKENLVQQEDKEITNYELRICLHIVRKYFTKNKPEVIE